MEAELKRAAAGAVRAPDWWGHMGPGVRQNFHVLWRSNGATSSAASGFAPDSKLLWELTRPYCGLSRRGLHEIICWLQLTWAAFRASTQRVLITY